MQFMDQQNRGRLEQTVSSKPQSPKSPTSPPKQTGLIKQMTHHGSFNNKKKLEIPQVAKHQPKSPKESVAKIIVKVEEPVPDEEEDLQDEEDRQFRCLEKDQLSFKQYLRNRECQSIAKLNRIDEFEKAFSECSENRNHAKSDGDLDVNNIDLENQSIEIKDKKLEKPMSATNQKSQTEILKGSFRGNPYKILRSSKFIGYTEKIN